MTFQVPVAREKKERDVSSSSSSGSGSSKNREGKSIDLPAPLDNPFLESTLEKKGDGNIKKHRRGAPQKIFVSAFKERSRYVWDFEQIDVLGEGQFSVVCYARKRLDGQMYAIKKLKTKITGDKGGALMTREAQAHAALNGCPNLTQYFNSWLDDHTLCIQTELCPYGSLESLVASLPLELASAKDGEEAQDVNVSCDDPDATQDVDAMSDEDDDEQANNSFNYGTQNSQEDSAGNDLQESPPKSTAPTFAGVPEPVAWLVLSETARALAFMHAKEMVHLDIRPSNIFIASASGNENVSENGKLVRGIAPGQIVEWLLCGEAQLKVGDLGQCCRADEKNIQEGESRYCSRELINEDEKLLDLYKADVFSLGATVYELMLGRRLHAGEEGNNEWHSLRDGVFAAHLETGRYSPELLSTLRALMAPLPCNRPGAQAIVQQCREMSALQVHADVSKAVSPTASESQKMNSLLLELQQLRSENARLKGGEMN
jgi:serine/threonine protein kinase